MDHVRALVERQWYDAAAQLLSAAGDRPEAERLAVIARRILDLDAEDFQQLTRGQDAPWAARVRQSCFPTEPRSEERGALGSLMPLYELMLEVLDVRARREEPMGLVVTAHLIGEYLPQLAWESRFGHAGDPLRMSDTVGERWGSDSEKCPHAAVHRSAAKRSLHACDGDVEQYVAYLDRFHSRQGEALTVCAMNEGATRAGERPEAGDTCPNPCGWAAQGSAEERRSLDARNRLARMYVETPIVALRHHAPVGHFFGVPSTREISDAWLATWDRLSRPWRDGGNPLDGKDQGRPAADEALPGMSRLVSAIAGRPIGPGTVLRDLGEEIVAAL